jgi:hypothetical protein
VPVAADPQQLEVDAPGGGDRAFVCGAGSRDVVGLTVGSVQVVRREVDQGGELPLDDLAVALRVPRRQAEVLVEGERRGVGERDLAGLEPSDQLGVDRRGAGTGGQAQDRGRLRPDQVDDGVRDEAGPLLLGLEDHDLHRSAHLSCAS